MSGPARPASAALTDGPGSTASGADGREERARIGYREVASTLQGRIEGGEFSLGSYLPTERELQERHGVSRTTVRRALASLVDAGWAEALPGRGVVAARGFRRATSGRVAFIDSDSYVANMLHVEMRDGLRALGLEPVNLGRGAGCSMEEALRTAVKGEFAAALVWSYEGFPTRSSSRRSIGSFRSWPWTTASRARSATW